MDNLKKFFIDGKWVEPATSETMKVLNPSNDETIGIVALGSDEDVNNAVKVAKRAFETYSKTTKKDRLALLKELKFVTEKRFEDLAQAMRQEMGAPISMARSAQADAAIGHLDSFIDALNELEERTKLINGDILLKEPIGCLLYTSDAADDA